jgi:hypothetical protein
LDEHVLFWYSNPIFGVTQEYQLGKILRESHVFCQKDQLEQLRILRFLSMLMPCITHHTVDEHLINDTLEELGDMIIPRYITLPTEVGVVSM